MAKYGGFKYGTNVKYGGNILWIYDRSVTDIINDTEKAYINYTDLNRIEIRMKELMQQLNTAGYKNKITTKTNWIKPVSTTTMDNIPNEEHLDRIRNNLITLIDTYYKYRTTPTTPNTLKYATIYTINDVEKILYDMHRIIQDMKNDYKKCGLLLCGGVNI